MTICKPQKIKTMKIPGIVTMMKTGTSMLKMINKKMAKMMMARVAIVMIMNQQINHTTIKTTRSMKMKIR